MTPDHAHDDHASVRPALLAFLDRAIIMSDERVAKYPAYAALADVRAQLLAVRQDVARGGPPDGELKRRVRFGYFAARELEDMGPAYAEVLKDAAYLYRQRYGPPVYPGL